MMVGLIILICVALQGSTGMIVKSPLNTAVLVGESVTLQCSINETDQVWTEAYSYGTISNNDVVLVAYEGIYDIEGTEKNYNLVLLSAQYDIAGRHECNDVYGHVSSGAEVIVLGSEPICTANSSLTNHVMLVGEYVHYACTIYYQGALAPKMKWVTDTGHEVLTKNSIKGHLNPKVVEYTYSSVIERSDQGFFLTMETYFDIPNNMPRVATNAPDFRHESHSHVINVHYPPDRLLLHTCNDSICVEIDQSVTEIHIQQWDWIRASADANPMLEYYIWTYGSHTLAEGPSRNEVTFENDGIFDLGCTARNTLRDGTQTHVYRNLRIYVDFTQTTYVPTTEPNPLLPSGPHSLNAGAIAAIVMICLLLGAVILGVVFILPRLRRKGIEKDDSWMQQSQHYEYPDDNDFKHGSKIYENPDNIIPRISNHYVYPTCKEPDYLEPYLLPGHKSDPVITSSYQDPPLPNRVVSTISSTDTYVQPDPIKTDYYNTTHISVTPVNIDCLDLERISSLPDILS